MSLLAPSLQAYFTDRLLTQRQASQNTIAAYRHTFKLLLRFATDRTGKQPSELDIAQLDAPLIASFLDHLEHARGNTIQTRNNRLAAIHSLFAYLALDHPEHADTIQRVLAIPHKRTTKNLLTYLTEPEVNALLAACDQTTWTDRRDHAMLALTIQTRPEDLRAHRTHLSRHHARHGRQRPHDRQGTESETNTAHPPNQNDPHDLAQGARWQPERSTIPDQYRHTTQPRRDRTPPRSPPRRRHQQLPVTRRQAHHDAHAASHRRDAPAARRQRHHRHRPLARTRTDHNHPDLPTRGHDPQAASDRSHPTDRRQTRSLPTHRHAPRLPRSALTMPSTPTRSPPPKRDSSRFSA